MAEGRQTASLYSIKHLDGNLSFNPEGNPSLDAFYRVLRRRDGAQYAQGRASRAVAIVDVDHRYSRRTTGQRGVERCRPVPSDPIADGRRQSDYGARNQAADDADERRVHARGNNDDGRRSDIVDPFEEAPKAGDADVRIFPIRLAGEG